MYIILILQYIQHIELKQTLKCIVCSEDVIENNFNNDCMKDFS